MLTRSYSAGIEGVEGYLITVEADVDLGLPGLTLVGRIGGALNEARQRVRAALGHCGHQLSPRKQLVNLAPADRRKDSSGIDLSIACALLASHELIPASELTDTLLWGELALDGKLRAARGTLVVADTARRFAFKRVVVPQEVAAEAALIPGVEVIGVEDLASLVAFLRGELKIDPTPAPEWEDATGLEGPDMSEVRGLAIARLAVEVMVAGGHNLLLFGPPGVGKTMLARRAAGLMPSLRPEAALEVTKIHTLHRARALELLRQPPIRMPHHTVSPAGLLGGGNPPRPGEVSLAHRGLLFLDELPEFPRACIEGLREPLEDGRVSIVRAGYSLEMPARFQLMAAMNPCPCGYLGHPTRACVDSPRTVQRYQQKVSGPFMDRMDLIVGVQAADPDQLAEGSLAESSALIRARIVRAQARQSQRFGLSEIANNAEIPASPSALAKWLSMQDGAQELLSVLARQRELSPRAQHRMRRVARTLMDLEPDPRSEGASPPITREAIAQAAHLRRPPEYAA